MTQALNRLQQATDAMKRGGTPQPGADAARQAADRLREATNLLAGTQQQLATGKLDSMAREAGQLTQEERTQADQINKLASPQGNSGTTDMNDLTARIRERDQLADKRQQLSNDLSNLQRNLRSAAREMAPNQPETAQKLRDALTEMDKSDLDNHVQRTADWLRSGINPNSNGTEKEIAQGLEKLSQQLQQAQQGMGQGQPGQRGTSQGDETAALNQVERLRSQIEAMASMRGSNGQAGQNGQNQNRQGQNGQGQTGQGQNGQAQNGQGQNGQGQNGQRAGQQSGNGRDQGRNGQQAGGNGQNGQQQGGGFGQQAGNNPTQRGGNGIAFGGDVGNRNLGGQAGDVRNNGGRGADGTVWGNFNTGNNRYGQARQQNAPTDASGNPADTERTYQQGMRDLSQLRQLVQNDPQTEKEIADLTRQMQQLDPSRFPGNPAMVEQMHREVLSTVDKLELQLQRNGASTEARTGKPDAVPAGYQESVAEYFRRLSKNQ